MNDQSTPLVLVTGAGSYIGLHCVLQLLESSYSVRGTLRNLDRQTHIREVLRRHVDADDRLEFCEADLLLEDGWAQATQDCVYVLHLASPFPVVMPKDERDLIQPAREGTLRVLRAAANAGVRRVVLTSSMAAINAGHAANRRTFDENDWSNLVVDVDAYSKSKTLAEKAAWEFMEGISPAVGMELVVINPSLVIGPVLDEEYRGTSGILTRELLRRKYPGCVDISFSLVDVRDVAWAHLKALQTPEAAGQRFCCVAGELWMKEVAEILNHNYSKRGYPVRTNKLPNAALHLLALFDPAARATKRDLGRINHTNTGKIREVLGWQSRPLEESLVDMAESMITLKMI